MSRWRVTVRTNGGDLRGTIAVDDDDGFLSVLNTFAGQLSGVAVFSPAPADSPDGSPDGSPEPLDGLRGEVGSTSPSTLHMDGTSPVLVNVRATTDELRDIAWSTVELRVVGPHPRQPFLARRYRHLKSPHQDPDPGGGVVRDD